jgi:hypothetical protein
MLGQASSQTDMRLTGCLRLSANSWQQPAMAKRADTTSTISSRYAHTLLDVSSIRYVEPAPAATTTAMLVVATGVSR